MLSVWMIFQQSWEVSENCSCILNVNFVERVLDTSLFGESVSFSLDMDSRPELEWFDSLTGTFPWCWLICRFTFWSLDDAYVTVIVWMLYLSTWQLASSAFESELQLWLYYCLEFEVLGAILLKWEFTDLKFCSLFFLHSERKPVYFRSPVSVCHLFDNEPPSCMFMFVTWLSRVYNSSSLLQFFDRYRGKRVPV